MSGAVGGGEETGPSPVDRSKSGSKHAILTDGQGVPLVIDTIPANTPDANQAVPLVDAVPPIAGKPATPGNARTMRRGTGALMTKTVPSCGNLGSTRSLASGGRPTAAAWVCIAGWWSERSVGFISSAGSVCVTIAATISIKGSVTWPKSSSLSGSCTCMVLLRVHHWAGLFNGAQRLSHCQSKRTTFSKDRRPHAKDGRPHAKDGRPHAKDAKAITVQNHDALMLTRTQTTVHTAESHNIVVKTADPIPKCSLTLNDQSVLVQYGVPEVGSNNDVDRPKSSWQRPTRKWRPPSHSNRPRGSGCKPARF